jgi:predicted TIM-barrel enzyme
MTQLPSYGVAALTGIAAKANAATAIVTVGRYRAMGEISLFVLSPLEAWLGRIWKDPPITCNPR